MAIGTKLGIPQAESETLRHQLTAGSRDSLAIRILHDLRRSAVRNLERAGVPRSIAMKLTGHKTESIYLRYDIVDEADLRDGLEKLADHFGPQSGPQRLRVVG